MKKYNLFKVLGIAVFLVVVMTWIIKTASFQTDGLVVGDRMQIGLFTLGSYVTSSVSFFGYLSVFLLAVGGFYGVLNKTGTYATLVEKIVKKLKGKEKIFLVVVMSFMAALTSALGIDMGLFIFIPFLISIILKMGYDRIVALLTTIGAVLVGVLGATYNYFISGYITAAFSLDLDSNIIFRLLILVFGVAILAYNTLSYAKKHAKKAKPKSKKPEEAKEKTVINEEVDPLYIDTKETKKSSVPLMVVLSLIFILLILGVTPWASSFGLSLFENMHTSITELEIGTFPIFGKLFGTVSAFGKWWYNELTVLLLLSSLFLGLIYGVKFSDILKSFVEGAKKLLPAALIVLLAYTVLIMVSYHPFFYTIADWFLDISKGFNALTFSIVSLLSSALYVDMEYISQGVIPLYTNIITSGSSYPIMAFIVQVMHGLAMFIAPTSIILLIGLAYLDVSYTKWIKNIWKLLLQLFALVILILIIVAII